MYAIVEIAGQQFKVEQGRKIFVHRQSIPEGDVVEFDQVLLLEDGDTITVGEPTIKDVVVEGKVIDNTVRGEKVIVFKKKRKKGYRVKNGHRQDFTQVEILSIGARKANKTAAKESKPAEKEVKPTETKAVDTESAVTEIKKAAPKKAATKKVEVGAEEKIVAAKKPAAKKPAAKTTTSKKSATKGSDKE
jgi:large subunit ribosomal protein L21